MTRTSAPNDAACENPRRTALLDAATSVLATSGLRGLTHRAVDRQAGFPEGTCSVSFRTRAALLAGLTTHVGSRVAVQVRALGEQIPSGTDDPLATAPFATALLERWVTEDDGALMVAILELSLESLRTPELAPAVGEWRSELVSIVETIVCRTSETGARSDSRLRAETAVASIEGIVLSALAQPAERRGPYIDKTLRMVLLGTASPEDARPTH